MEYHSPTVSEPSGLYLPSLIPLAVTQLQTSVEKQIVCTLYEGTVLWFLIRHEEIPQFLLRCSYASIAAFVPGRDQQRILVTALGAEELMGTKT